MNEDKLVEAARTLIISEFSAALGGISPTFHVKARPDGEYLVFEFSEPTDRLFSILNDIDERLDEGQIYKDRLSLTARAQRPSNPLAIPEIALLQRELSASLTVDRHTFGPEFLDRYTASVTDLETPIVVNANHVVYGRRGSGKSSLLAFAMHKLRMKRSAFAWIAMQAYASRNDRQAIASVLAEIFSELAPHSSTPAEFEALSSELERLGESENEAAVVSRLERIAPRMRKMLGSIAVRNGSSVTLFLDDLHVLGHSLQPELLHSIYSLTRGNNAYIKISGIEQLTNTWDSVLRHGLEAPHDVQTLMLDHNLTTPDQSRDHIKSILDRHAKYCGLPSIDYISSPDYLDRLVLSAAAVPRDALNLFTKSIARSILKGQKAVSITSLNAAASEAVEEKLKDIERDISADERTELSTCLDQVKKFCLSINKKNAFLVKIVNSSSGYQNVQRLVALRFVHLLHQGITPHKAGERFIALMLDYGFYIGIRAAKSVVLFPEKPRQLAAKDLRNLPILVPHEAGTQP